MPRLRLLLLIVVLLLVFGIVLPVTADETFDLMAYPLLFRRDTAPTTDQPVTILMGGDISLAYHVNTYAINFGVDAPFMAIAPALNSVDLAVANYEGVIVPENVGERRPGAWRHRTDPEAVATLQRAGFDLLTVANNHSMDWGPEGLAAMVNLLNEAGIETLGGGATPTEAQTPLVTETRDVRIAWLAYNLAPDPPAGVDLPNGWSRALLGSRDKAKLVSAVKAARPLGDALIVQLHWGDEYTLCPTQWQYQMAEAAVDAGASLVVGHHPHVIQKTWPWKDGLIVFSLGNFVFYQEEYLGLALLVRIDTEGLLDVRALMMETYLQGRFLSPETTKSDLPSYCNSRFVP